MRSGRRKSVVDIYYSGQLLFPDVPISEGAITLDRNSDSRASGVITVASNDFDLSVLEPWGSELVVKSGVVYDNGDEELVPMGVFRLNEDSVSEGQSETPSVQFFDRARAVIETQIAWDQDFSGWLSQSTISQLVTYSLPDVNISFDPSLGNLRLPGGTVYSNTNWDGAKETAQGIGAEIYFDRAGDCIVAPPPAVSSTTPVSAAVWTIGVGEDGTLTEANRGVSRENTYNGVSLYGAQTDDQVRPWAFVYDDNPQSKTYYYGPFGRKTIRLENATLTTNTQCLNAARELLKNYVGLGRTVSFSCLANPALDPGDIVLFKFFDGDELHLIDQLTIPLGTGQMSGSTRTAQFVA